MKCFLCNGLQLSQSLQCNKILSNFYTDVPGRDTRCLGSAERHLSGHPPRRRGILFASDGAVRRRETIRCTDRYSSEKRDRLKIAYVVTRAEPIGGVQIHVRDLAVSLRAQGHMPTILTGG